MLVPRPLDDLDQTLPLASCWIEERQPLRLPLTVRESEKEQIALPDLTQTAKPLAIPSADPTPEADTLQAMEPLPQSDLRSER
jgi:carbon dioxide concentrating mechanism protein CcmO